MANCTSSKIPPLIFIVIRNCDFVNLSSLFLEFVVSSYAGLQKKKTESLAFSRSTETYTLYSLVYRYIYKNLPFIYIFYLFFSFTSPLEYIDFTCLMLRCDMASIYALLRESKNNFMRREINGYSLRKSNRGYSMFTSIIHYYMVMLIQRMLKYFSD